MSDRDENIDSAILEALLKQFDMEEDDEEDLLDGKHKGVTIIISDSGKHPMKVDGESTEEDAPADDGEEMDDYPLCEEDIDTTFPMDIRKKLQKIVRKK